MDNTYTQTIYDLYSDYIRWSSELMGSFGGIKMFSQMFTGGGEYKNREEHRKFFADCGIAAEEYFAAMKDGRTGTEELPNVLRLVLVDCHYEGDDWADWMLLAAEKHFIPFVDMLSREEAVELYEPYRRLRRGNRGLPPQDEILKKLKKMAK